MKFVWNCQVECWVLFKSKTALLRPKNTIFDKIIFDLTISWCQQSSYDLHLGVIINSAKFRGCIFSTFRRVKLKKVVKHKIACCIVNNPWIKKLCFGNDVVDIFKKSHQQCYYGQYLLKNWGNLILQLISDCDVIVDWKRWHLFEIGMSSAGFYLSSK